MVLCSRWIPTVLALVVGCSGAQQSKAVEAGPHGLSVRERSAQRLRGAFVDGTGFLDFDFAQSERTSHATIELRDGVRFLESTLTDGVERTRFLGGQVEVAGRIDDEKPQTIGDEALLHKPAIVDAIARIHALWAALEQAGVALPGPARAPARPSRARVGARQVALVPTWSFWRKTVLTFTAVAQPARARIRAPLGHEVSVYISTGSATRATNLWWGFCLRVENTSSSPFILVAD